jgi:hypothetical protein
MNNVAVTLDDLGNAAGAANLHRQTLDIAKAGTFRRSRSTRLR